jgi:hypothetical protein
VPGALRDYYFYAPKNQVLDAVSGRTLVREGFDDSHAKVLVGTKYVGASEFLARHPGRVIHAPA